MTLFIAMQCIGGPVDWEGGPVDLPAWEHIGRSSTPIDADHGPRYSMQVRT